MRADNLPALRAAQQKRHASMVARTLETLERLLRDRPRLTYASLAAAAGVSRSWLYRQPEVRHAVDCEIARQTAMPRPTRVLAPPSDASREARIRTLLEDNRRLREELDTARTRLSELMGQLREAQYARKALP